MNAKRLADHLERRGLATSAQDPDHRQRRVLRPTAEGRALARVVTARARTWERELAERVGDDALDRLREGLDALRAAAEALGEAPAREEAP